MIKNCDLPLINFDNKVEIIDEVEIIKNNFKINKVNYSYNDISFEIYNHNGKYYFFHHTVYDEIIRTKKNPYNGEYLLNNVVMRIILKRKLHALILKLKSFKDDFNFNELYNEFSQYETMFISKLNYIFVKYLYDIHISYKFINENLILQICTNLGYEINQTKENKLDVLTAVLGYLVNKFF